MKHILPILTLALLGAAVTATAGNYYYDYYLNPPNTTPIDNNPSGYHNQSDTFTYGTRDNQGNTIDNPAVFTLARESNWGNNLDYYANKDNFYRVEFANYVGGVDPETSQYTVNKISNKDKVTLYLTDFVSEVVPQSNGPYNSSSNALFNMGIVEYGYRELTSNGDGTYTAKNTTVSYDILVPDEDGKIVVNDKKYRLSDNVTPIDSVSYFGDDRSTIRYKYELGTFDPDTIIEVYMKDADGREVYSFSSYGVNEDGEDVYTPFDKTNPEVNNDSNGGFGDGGYRIAAREFDKMLYSYYFVEELPNVDGTKRVNSDYQEESLEKFDPKKDIKLASGKAMPLSELTPMGNLAALGLGTTGTAVQFGFYGVTAGSPLPGGLQSALIAGLFGLGFFYVRRRKAIAG